MGAYRCLQSVVDHTEHLFLKRIEVGALARVELQVRGISLSDGRVDRWDVKTIFSGERCTLSALTLENYSADKEGDGGGGGGGDIDEDNGDGSADLGNSGLAFGGESQRTGVGADTQVLVLPKLVVVLLLLLLLLLLLVVLVSPLLLVVVTPEMITTALA